MRLTETLDITDLELIILLQEKPIANYSSIAKILNLSSPTVKRRLDRLYDKVIKRIVAIPQYSRLNLIPVSSFLIMSNFNHFSKTEALIDKHPYLYFRVRNYGYKNGIHATFRIPENGLSLLEKFLEQLVSLDLIDNYFYFKHQTDFTVRSTPRFSAYIPKTGIWEFSWKKWIDTPEDKLLRKDPIDKPDNFNTMLKSTEYVDLEILSLISLDSRQKNVEILEKLTSEISPQRLSDKLKELKQKFVSTYRVYLNWDVFDFTEVIFNGQTDSNFFKNLLSTYPPPFQSTFRDYETKDGKTGFIWYLSCPPSHVVDAFEAIMNISNETNFYLINRKQQYRAPLNILAFDEESMDWKVSEEFLFNRILKS